MEPKETVSKKDKETINLHKKLQIKDIQQNLQTNLGFKRQQYRL